MDISFNSLKPVEELKGRYLKWISQEDILKLAKDGIAPCYVLTNPATKEQTYLFIATEITDWLVDHYLLIQEGIKPPVSLNFYLFNKEDFKITYDHKVPKELVGLKGLNKLPDSAVNTPPGIYFLCKEGELVYIGQGVCPFRRIAQHKHESEKDFDSVYYISVPVALLTEIESALIRVYRPKYNQTCNGSAKEGDSELIEVLYK